MALARIRQLAAHEVGHTLGFAHNFAASSYGRALGDGLSGAVGRDQERQARSVERLRDRHRRRSTSSPSKFAYSQFPAGANEAAELEAILEAGVASGMLYIDRLRRSSAPTPRIRSPACGTAAAIRSPRSRTKWRCGGSGCRQFGLRNIPVGTPLSELELKLLPLYLHHRYQLQAAVKSLGGVYFTYAVRTAGGPNPARWPRVVPAERQRAALEAVLDDAVSVDALRIPERILDLIPPDRIRLRRRYGGGVRTPDRSRPSIRSAPPASPPTSRSARCSSPHAPRASCSNRRVTRQSRLSPRSSRVSWTRRGGRRCRPTVTAARSQREVQGLDRAAADGSCRQRQRIARGALGCIRGSPPGPRPDARPSARRMRRARGRTSSDSCEGPTHRRSAPAPPHSCGRTDRREASVERSPRLRDARRDPRRAARVAARRARDPAAGRFAAGRAAAAAEVREHCSRAARSRFAAPTTWWRG